MTILRHPHVITSAAWLAGSLAWCMASIAAAGDWRAAATDTLTRETVGHRMVVLGEMHGTREVPLLTGDLVARWSEAGPVLLALEIPVREHDALRAAVTGGGDDEAIERLRGRSWWQTPASENDGRRSEDVLALVRRVGQLKAQGRDVAILPFDPRDIRCYRRGDCEAAMARVLRHAHEALPAGRIVVVAGNLHAMRQRPSDPASAFAGQTPMTAHLHDLRPLSVDVTAERGRFWACQDFEACGPVTLARPRPGGRQPDAAPYDYRLVLPQFTPIRQIGDAVP